TSGNNTMIGISWFSVEAMTMADRIIVLNDGKIEQIGTPNEIYEHPASTFVASFMGAPPMNLLQGIAGGGKVALGSDQDVLHTGTEGHDGPVQAGIRPEDIWPDPQGDLAFDVDIIEELGALRLLHGRVAGQDFSVAVPKDKEATTGPMLLSIKPGAVHLFDADTGLRL
ncbi:MAG TPA: sn-glycerol-3-phosphate ABC transporter ATP-binding protein UgpC, partial [Roseibacterium sp.]|nr:sn-glycerol-3-phosphate ABC transporter ATP-binding protein UgpC [Roseibacterium sp.]